MDVLSSEQRSRCMSRIRSKDTKPEMAVRMLAHKLGYRFRLHRSGLPGKPDLVFPSRKKVIFVHGCFWHRHKNCRLASIPKSRLDYWLPKFERTQRRDAEALEALTNDGWQSLVVWECEGQVLRSLGRKVKNLSPLIMTEEANNAVAQGE